MHIRQPTVAELLAHAPWVRQLAGELVGDASRADDVAQDAMLAALQRPPRPGNVRGWLATVVTNATRAQRRADRRRAARERRAARPERAPATADVVARAGVHRQLVTLVLELEEPFRTVILLRFFDGLTVPDIAARLSIPTKTVHSRLARGVERLRGHLDAQHGERHVWIAALAPLLDPSARATALAAASGAMVMHSKTKLFGLLATLAVAGAATLPWMLRQSSPSDGLPNVPATVAADHAALDATPAPTPAPPRTIVEPEPPPPSAPAAIVLGVVLGPDGQELPNFAVALARGGKHMTQTTTDASGRFELAVTEREGTIVADQPGWTTVAAGMLWADDKPCALLVAPAIEIGGHVFDEQGLPVPSAVVELRLGRGFDLRFDAILEASQRQAWRTKSDARGAFHLPAAPETDAGQLVASSAGFDELVQPAPSQSDLGLRLTLERQGTPTLRGEVVDPAGARLAGAWVGLGGRVTRTEADGTFSIQLDDEVRRARTLRAVAKGFAPAVQEALGPVPWPDFVRLALVELAAPIAGRVVDERGEPVAARVWLEDPTSLGDHDGLPTHAEFISDGAPAETDDDGRSPLWSWVSTDASGRFQIGGLTTRTYQLRAATEDLLTTRSPPIAAGATDVLLVIDRSARVARRARGVR
ncbi:MAG: sigma-70 family RNA polymerase sigma factor [Planctomycetota bacterium]